MMHVNNMSYVNNMTYACTLYELSLKIACFRIFLSIYKDGKPKL